MNESDVSYSCSAFRILLAVTDLIETFEDMFFFLFIDACSGIRDNYFGILFQGIGQCIVFLPYDGNIYVSFFRSKLEGIRQNIQDILSNYLCLPIHSVPGAYCEVVAGYFLYLPVDRTLYINPL